MTKSFKGKMKQLYQLSCITIRIRSSFFSERQYLNLRTQGHTGFQKGEGILVSVNYKKAFSLFMKFWGPIVSCNVH